MGLRIYCALAVEGFLPITVKVLNRYDEFIIGGLQFYVCQTAGTKEDVSVAKFKCSVCGYIFEETEEKSLRT